MRPSGYREALRARTCSAVVAASLIVLVSCKRGGGDDGASSSGGIDAGGFDKATLLRAWGECAFDGFKEFRAASVELDTAARRAETDATPAARDAAREAWKKAIDTWQRAELFGFGPTAATSSPGGKDLRDPIYAWPLVNRCLIEQQIVERSYDKPEFVTGLVNARGLAAAEYVLFYDGIDNTCAPTASINASGAWSALGAAEIGKRKVSYARAIAADTSARAQAIVAAWDPAQGNFLGELANAGQSKTFTTQQMAFNAVSTAFFYIDDFMKNLKVGKPAGIVPGCAAPPCIADVESPWAKRSKEHLKNNLIGFDRLLRGCGADGQGLGWDDLLGALGPQATALATKLASGVTESRAALDALTEASFEVDLERNAIGVKRLYDTLRTIVVLLKTEFLSILDLELPKRVEGDND